MVIFHSFFYVYHRITIKHCDEMSKNYHCRTSLEIQLHFRTTCRTGARALKLNFGSPGLCTSMESVNDLSGKWSEDCSLYSTVEKEGFIFWNNCISAQFQEASRWKKAKWNIYYHLFRMSHLRVIPGSYLTCCSFHQSFCSWNRRCCGCERVSQD